MNSFVISSLLAFALFGMGLIALILGITNYRSNKESKTGKFMLILLSCVFLWNFGYAWMSLCYDSDIAYIARALALVGVYLYAYFLNRYMASLIKVSSRKMLPYHIVIGIAGVLSWFKIIQKDAVEFHHTAWGYWYTSGMSWGRTVQFVCIFTATAMFYIILAKGLKSAKLKRERYIYKGYLWFGPMLFFGYSFDTLFPNIFKTAAVPGSSIAAFFSTILLYNLCREYNAYGISSDIISTYVYNDVNVPVVVADYQKNIALFNKCVPTFFDVNEDELNNIEFKHFLQNLCNEFEEKTGKSVLETDLLSFESKKRGLVEFKLASNDIYDRFGEILYSIYFIQDVTADRRALRSVEESRQIAEDANMAKSNFLANMSHEIRTPMNAIMGLSEIIIQNDPQNTSLEKVHEIKHAAGNLLGIINDILDISKIEAGKYEIINDNYTLSTLINDVSSIIRVRVQESGIRFVLQIDETLPESLVGDENRIRQVLLNILGNAVKFTKQGSITLSASWNGNRDNPELIFDITDTGIGIKKEDIDTIFGVFNQVDTRRNRSVQGSGLGLAISRELARLMSGDITVKSEYNEGSTFSITIKQTIDNYQAIGKAMCDALINNKYNAVISQKIEEEIIRPDTKVLVVDDVEMNLLIAQGLLQKYQISADIALSGKEAVELTKKTKYDLIFMDHMMPEMDGIDTARAIRSIPDGLCAKTPIVALTANALTEAKELFEREGFSDFLAKPIDPKILDEIIIRWS